MVLPTGIATDATTAKFFGTLVRGSRLASFEEFENEAFLLSKDVDHRIRFCLLSACGRGRSVPGATFAFGVRHIQDLPERRLIMPPSDLLLVNPNTGTTPLFRSRRDAEITLDIYRRVPVLRRKDPKEDPWHVSFMRMFDMTNDSGLFMTREGLLSEGWTLAGNAFIRDGKHMLPLYEARMTNSFDNRFGTYEGRTKAQANMGTLPRPSALQKVDPMYTVAPQYWVDEIQVERRLSRRAFACKSALLGHRRVARNTDERSCIACLIPWGAVSYGLILSVGPSARELACLAASYNSFAYDYLLRNSFSQASVPQSTSEQIPVPGPSKFLSRPEWSERRLRDWMCEHVLELCYSAWDMEPFAQDLGDEGPPFVWDEERRFLMRAELDAAYFHLYGIDRDDVDYIMDSFGAFRRNDPNRFARTKNLILEIYDQMTEAITTGTAYRALLNPPPGHGPRYSARRLS
jgi:hypothetical protein